MTLVTQQAGDENPQDQSSRGAASLQDIRLRRTRRSSLAPPPQKKAGDITRALAAAKPAPVDPETAPQDGNEPPAPPPSNGSGVTVQVTPPAGPRPTPPTRRLRPARRPDRAPTPGDIVSYWTGLRSGRRFPSWSDLDPEQIKRFWPYSVLLSCGAGAGHLELEAMFSSAARADGAGGPGGSIKVVEYTPMVTDWILTIGRQVADNGRPMQDSEIFPTPNGEVCYRLVALPLSDNDDGIDHVLCHVGHN